MDRCPRGAGVVRPPASSSANLAQTERLSNGNHRLPKLSWAHITVEQTGKSQSYIVWLNKGCSAVRKATVGLNVPNAFDRAKGKLEPSAPKQEDNPK